MAIRIPVRLTTEVKEQHLHGRIGWIVTDDPFTDMQFSFIVDIGDRYRCQCGRFEIEMLKPDDPDYQKVLTMESQYGN